MMKKVVIFALLWCVAPYGWSQARYGITVGAGVSSYLGGKYQNGLGEDTDPQPENGFIDHYRLGFTSNIPIALGGALSVAPELYYSGQGNQYEQVFTQFFRDEIFEDSLSLKTRHRANYIKLNLLVRYRIIEGLYVNIGPEVGWQFDISGTEVRNPAIKGDVRRNAAGNALLDNDGNEIRETTGFEDNLPVDIPLSRLQGLDKLRLTRLLSTWQFSLTGGVGYMITDAIGIDLRYSRSFTGVYNDNVTDALRGVSSDESILKSTHQSHYVTLSFVALF